MAINYNYGINPNMGQFVSSYLRGTGMQADAYAEEERAKAKAKAQVQGGFMKMVGNLASAYAQHKKGEQDLAKDTFKEDYTEEKARLTDSRNQYQVGTDSWKEQNDAIFNLKKEYKGDLKAYKESGVFNRDASLLEFGSSDPEFTGLSDASQAKITGNDQLIADLQDKRDGVEKTLFNKQEFLKRRETTLDKRVDQRQERLAQKRQEAGIQSSLLDPESKGGGTALKNVLERQAGGTHVIGADDPMFKQGADTLKSKFKQASEAITKEGDRLGTKTLKEQQVFEQTKDFQTKKLNSELKNIDSRIAFLRKSNKKEFSEGEKNLEGYDFDSRTGVALNRSDLKLHEQRRYQEKQRKAVNRGKAIGIMVASGVDMTGVDTTDTPYAEMTQTQLEAVQANAIDPKLRQEGGDLFTHGVLLDKTNPRHVQIAEAYHIPMENFNQYIKEGYEAKAQGRLKSAGTNYKALEAVIKDIKTKDPSILEGTMLTDGFLNQTVADAKGAHQKGMYTSMSQVVNMEDPGAMRGWVSTNKDRIAQYEKDGILPKGFGVSSQNLVESSVKSKLDGVRSKKLGKDLTELKKFVDLGSQGMFTDKGVNAEIIRIATEIGVENPQQLITDSKAREKLDRELKNIQKETNLLSYAEKARRKLYTDEYGTGPQITGVNVTEDGSVGFHYKRKSDGKIDVKDAVKKFIASYQNRTGMTLTIGNTVVKEYEDYLNHYNMTHNAEASLKRGLGL